MALDLTDKTANGNNLTNNNAVAESATTPFVASTASASFAVANSKYLSITDAAQTGLDLATTFTLEAYINFTNVPAGAIQVVMSKEDDNAALTRSYVVFCGVNTIEVIASDGNGNFDYYNVANTWNASTWYHVAVTCNTGNASATTFEFFVNGVSLGNGVAQIANNIATIKNSTTPFAIGARFGAATAKNFFDGLIDEVRVWSTVRTVGQISGNYQQRLVGNEAGLVAYYPFESLAASGGGGGHNNPAASFLLGAL